MEQLCFNLFTYHLKLFFFVSYLNRKEKETKTSSVSTIITVTALPFFLRSTQVKFLGILFITYY
jgi:hypothetical protein